MYGGVGRAKISGRFGQVNKESVSEKSPAKESFAEIVAREGISPPPSVANFSSPANVAAAESSSGNFRNRRGAILPPDCDSCKEEQYSRQTKYAANGADIRRVRNLLRQSAEAELDLHGMTAAKAHSALDDFLRAQLSGGRRYVEIIHGRGGHSADGRAILRGKTRMWLAECDAVLAFAEPRNNPGAVRVLLRREE